MSIQSWLGLVIVVITAITGENVGAQQRASGEVCDQARVVARLARIYGSADIEMIERETNRVCESGNTQGTLRWSNKERMKSSSGWFYPNGNDAIRTSGIWLYPNKLTAKSSGGAWSYPDGQTAKAARGEWTRPDREISRFSTEELRDWACPRVRSADCSRLSAEIGTGRTDEQILAALELAWLAR